MDRVVLTDFGYLEITRLFKVCVANTLSRRSEWKKV
jgi:hypothetical protein